MANKNNRKEQVHILSSDKLRLGFSFALMLPREDLIFQKLIGLYSMIHQMIQKIIFIELVEQQEELMGVAKVYYLFTNMKLDS
jgi:hypothetical protein